jgi:hypothetical protein
MRRVVLMLTTAVMMAGGLLHAHHGYGAFFDPSERTVAIEGDIERIAFGNPHVVMQIRTADATVYTAVWQSAMWVEHNAGATRSTFHAGDHVVVIGAPARDPQVHEITRISEVRRPSDHWVWRTDMPFAAPMR